MLEGLQWAQQLNCNKVIVQTDNKGVDEAVSLYNSCRKEDSNLFTHIRAMVSSFPSCVVVFVHRVCNKPADQLAKFACKHMYTGVWFENPPNLIRRQLLLDRS